MCAAITETLASGQQVMLFINRRGFAPIVQCRACGWHADCPDCSVGMVMHKRKRNDKADTSSIIHFPSSLVCHICGRTQPMPSECPECKGRELVSSGVGVEKIQEEVAARWPDARTAIVSSDTMMSRQALERLVNQMESGEIDIVIGTQILAKGHHFPNLTLVGVIDADMGLFGADFRAGERTFQQLFQVAGRAGRGEIPGRVLLQTYQPEHPVLKAIVAGDRDVFMAQDLQGRKAAGMPPFGQLIAVIVEGQKESVLQKFCADLAACAPRLIAPSLGGGSGRSPVGEAPSINYLPSEDQASPRPASQGTPLQGRGELKILGPVPAQIYQIRNWYRMRFLVSGPERAALQPAVKAWLGKVKIPANIKIKIDVSPQSFM